MNQNKKSIVILTSEFPPLPGGIGNHAYNLAKYLQQSGFEVSVVADQRDNLHNEAEFDASLKYSVHRIPKVKLRFWMYLKRVFKTHQLSKKADILICSGKFPLWLGAMLKPLLKVKSIAVIHGTEVNFQNSRLKKSINWSLKRFDKIVAVSNFTKSLVDDLGLQNIKVIPNGFSISHTDETKTILNLDGSPKLLTVGNVTKRKGQINVIKHLPELLKKYPELHYHCVGLKSEVEACKNLAKKLKVNNAITFHGHVWQNDLIQFYNNTDICVMLSQKTETGDVEGFGIALIEANYYGLPTIGAKGCGIEDAISHGKSGLLVDADNSTTFIEAVDIILNNKAQYSLGAKAWAKQHEWAQVIKQYVNFIQT